MMQAVLGDKADEVEKGTELQDLVANEDYEELVRLPHGGRRSTSRDRSSR